MRRIQPMLIAGALVLAPAAALAQMVIVDPPPVEGEVIIEPAPFGPPVVVGPPTIEDARLIAMANGVAVVEDVDRRLWDGNWEVEGQDAYGEDIEVVIDANSGAVLDIDD